MKMYVISVLLLAASLFAQEAKPMWIQDRWRVAEYPSAKWYIGFAMDEARGTPNQEQFNAIKRSAQNALSESIIVHIKGASSLTKKATETTADINYAQAITSSSNAVLAKVESYSYYDPANGYIYGFAAVKKADLANYYESVIKSGLDEAEQNLKLAAQLTELGKKRSALEKIGESKSKAEGLAYYKNLLLAVDSERGLERSQNSRLNELLKEIIVAAAETENAMLVYLEGNEETVVSNLQNILSGNKCRIADEQKDASYVLNIDAKACNIKNDGDFYHCYACVKADLTNSKTRKSELKINIDGLKIKGSEMSQSLACEQAFKSAASKLWSEIGNKMKSEACNK